MMMTKELLIDMIEHEPEPFDFNSFVEKMIVIVKIERGLEDVRLGRTVPDEELDDFLFEKDWQNAISGDEFVKRTHQHIDELYSKE